MVDIKKIVWLIVLFAFAVLMSSCSDLPGIDEERVYGRGEAVNVPWTILIYMGSDNDLEPYGIEDINELESVDLTNTALNIIVLVDRSPGYDVSNGDWTGTRMYRIVHDPLNLGAIVSERLAVPELGLSLGYETELNMGNPDVLRGALASVDRMYPDTNVGLIMWGHGSGYRSASVDITPPEALTKVVSYDFSDGNQGIYTSELALVLKDFNVSVVAFDACNGGHLEIAYEIMNYADYFVASEDLISADGWEYNIFLLEFLGSNGTPKDFAESAVTAFAERYQYYSHAGLSAVDLGKLIPVMATLDELSYQVSQIVVNEYTQALIRDRLSFDVEEFINVPGNHNLDIGDLADFFAYRLQGIFVPPALQDAAIQLREALNEAVIAEWHHPVGNSRATGLAVHYVQVDSFGEPSYFLHESAYRKGHNVLYPLQFVQDSQWVPDMFRETGLLYRLWHAQF